MRIRTSLAFVVLIGLVPRVALSAAPPNPEALGCGPIYGWETVASSGTVLLLGEIHGTEQGPGFVADVLCRAVAEGRDVVLAVDLPDTESVAVESYLNSDGDLAARQRLLSRPLWAASYQTGKTSAAIVRLLDGIRRLRSLGGRIDVELITPTDLEEGARPDRRMATRVEEIKSQRSPELLVAFTSLRHSRITAGSLWDPEAEPMGYLLGKWNPTWNMVALAISHSGGTLWVCTSKHVVDCHPLAVTGEAQGWVSTIELVDDAQARGHHGLFFVGPLTYSPPALTLLSESFAGAAEIEELPLSSHPER